MQGDVPDARKDRPQLVAAPGSERQHIFKGLIRETAKPMPKIGRMIGVAVCRLNLVVGFTFLRKPFFSLREWEVFAVGGGG